MKAGLVEHTKTTDELGNTIEVTLWKVSKSKDKPHGYKYSLVYIVDDKRVIGTMQKTSETTGIMAAKRKYTSLKV